MCHKEGILLEAYSSLGGTDNKDLLENAEVKKIAEKLGKSPAQVNIIFEEAFRYSVYLFIF